MTCQGKECTRISSVLPLGQGQRWHLHHLPSDAQLQQLCQTPLPLTAALPAPCRQDGTGTHAPKLPCVSNTFLLKKQKEIWGVRPRTSQQGQMFADANGGVVQKRSTYSRHTRLLSLHACPKSETSLGFVQFCQGP